MLLFVIEAILAVGLLVFLYANKYELNEPIAGIYRTEKRRFYYLKFCISWIYFKLKSIFFGSNDNDFTEDEENVKLLSIYGTGKPGESFIVENNKKLYLTLPDLTKNLLEIDSSSSNFIFKIPHYGKDISRNEGKIIYSGKIKDKVTNESYDIKLNAEWLTIYPIFNMYTEMSTSNFSKSIAAEMWCNDYFQCFDIFTKQQFLGQYGHIKAKIEINDKTYETFFNCASMFYNGPTHFKQFLYRYILHYIVTDDGDIFCFGIASFTQLFSSIPIGYMFSHRRDCKNLPIEYCDLKLQKFGENSAPPTEYSYLSGTKKEVFNTIVTTKLKSRFTVEDDYSRKIIDPACKFNINGKNGWGTVVWYYKK